MKLKNSKDDEINIPAGVEKLYIMMTQAALGFLNRGLNKDMYLAFSAEIWDSMKMSDPDELQRELCALYTREITQALRKTKENTDDGRQGNTYTDARH